MRDCFAYNALCISVRSYDGSAHIEKGNFAKASTPVSCKQRLGLNMHVSPRELFTTSPSLLRICESSRIMSLRTDTYTRAQGSAALT
eukprot:6200211-Pleurochrysis_carterae.AAC.10